MLVDRLPYSADVGIQLDVRVILLRQLRDRLVQRLEHLNGAGSLTRIVLLRSDSAPPRRRSSCVLEPSLLAREGWLGVQHGVAHLLEHWTLMIHE